MDDGETLDLDDVRTALGVERERALARAAGLRRDLDVLKEAAMDGGTDDEHDPEGTTAFDRARIQSLFDAAQAQVAEADALLVRLDEGGYGVCESCRLPIAPARLLARPLARTCITCASRR